MRVIKGCFVQGQKHLEKQQENGGEVSDSIKLSKLKLPRYFCMHGTSLKDITWWTLTMIMKELVAWQSRPSELKRVTAVVKVLFVFVSKKGKKLKIVWKYCVLQWTNCLQQKKKKCHRVQWRRDSKEKFYFKSLRIDTWAYRSFVLRHEQHFAYLKIFQLPKTLNL